MISCAKISPGGRHLLYMHWAAEFFSWFEVENVGVNSRWRMPRRGMVKINVHGCFFEDPLPNGNISGIGGVVRNSRGRILRMISGSLGIANRRNNEYHAMLEGCKSAFSENRQHFVLESDHLDSFWDWRNSTIEGVHPDYAFVVQQLNQRQIDRNFHMEVTLCDPLANALAMYLADHGARHYKTMVIISQPFGRIRELWSLDMGLGPVGPPFDAVHEEDLIPAVLNEDGAPEPEVADDNNDMLGEADGVEVIEILN
ncbi:hypothetical protein ACET3Z_002491 [Daucus carota]